MYPESIKNLIESFKYLPGIGEKTAERLTFSLLQFDDDQIEFFSDSILNLNKNIHLCPKCNTITDLDICSVCSDNLRNADILCVVEDSKYVFFIEKSGIFNGKYHVLNGLISPLNGINPENIGLPNLFDRIRNENFKELIFAFKPSIEGETTALYIKKLLDGMDIKITRLASGLPMGADMEYVDTLTLERALKDRKELS